MTMTDLNLIDAKGYCLEHPAIKLQRQTASGEWKALLSSCPLCVNVTSSSSSLRRQSSGSRNSGSSSVSGRRTRHEQASSTSTLSSSLNKSITSISSRAEELRRLTSREISNGSNDSKDNSNCGGDDNGRGKYQSDGLSPLHSGKSSLNGLALCKEISALSITSSTDRTDATVMSSSCSSASTSNSGGEELPPMPPLSSPLLQQYSSSSSSRRSSLPPTSPYSPSAHITSPGSAMSIMSSPGSVMSSSRRSSSGTTSKKSVVCGLRYTNPNTNRRGSYTGQLHPESQVPHGVGTLKYYDGSVEEGEWRDGVLCNDVRPHGSSTQATPSLRSKSRGRGRQGALDNQESQDVSERCSVSEAIVRSRSRGRRRETVDSVDKEQPDNDDNNMIMAMTMTRSRSIVSRRDSRSKSRGRMMIAGGDYNNHTTESDKIIPPSEMMGRSKSRGRSIIATTEPYTPNETRSRSIVRERARSKSRGRYEMIRPELKVPDFGNNDVRNNDGQSSWCGPCDEPPSNSIGNPSSQHLRDNGPIGPSSNMNTNSIGNSSSQHHLRDSSYSCPPQQQQQLVCAPCTPQGDMGYHHSRSSSYQDTPGSSSYSTNSSYDHRRHNSTGGQQQQHQSRNFNNNTRVELCLPSHFETGPLSPHSDQGGDDNKSQYSKYSQRSGTVSRHSGSARSSRKATGPYSARESKVSLDSIPSSSSSGGGGGMSRSRHAVDKNDFDGGNSSSGGRSQRSSRRNFVEVKR